MDRLSRAGFKCWAIYCWAPAVPLVNPMIFKPNNYNINVFGLQGFTWVTFGLLNSVEIPHNRPKWFVGYYIGYFLRFSLNGMVL